MKRIENNIEKIENEIQKISEIQDKIAFETEKNYLMNFFSYSFSEKQWFKGNIKTIFNEETYRFIDDSEHSFIVRFIKESEKPYALPKMYYPFSRISYFPYFCVKVFKNDQTNQDRIELDKYYYLSYVCFPFPSKHTGWYMSEEYPVEGSIIHKGFKISFFGVDHAGEKGPPPASVFCKSGYLRISSPNYS